MKRYLEIVQRWWWVLILVTVSGGGAAFGLARALPSSYEASAIVLVSQTPTTGQLTLNDVLLSERLVSTYSQLLIQPIVLDEVRARLDSSFNLDRMTIDVDARQIQDTQLIELVARARPAELARDLANTTAEVFIDQQRAESARGVALSVVQPALLPTRPTGPDVIGIIIVGVLAGAVAAAGIIGVLESLDDSIRTPEDLDAAAHLETIAIIKRDSTSSLRKRSHVLDEKLLQSPFAEAYRIARTSLEFLAHKHSFATLLVTGSIGGEGKTTTAANIGIVFGKAGKRVLLVDADLRNPSLHSRFGVDNSRGLTNLLLGEDVEPREYITELNEYGISLLPGGPTPPNPADAMALPEFAKVLKRLAAQSDIVILDSAPVLAVADSSILAALVDASILVVDASRTRPEVVRRATAMLRDSGSRLLGAILNNADSEMPRYQGNKK